MVTEIPVARKAIAGNTAFAALIRTQVWFVAVSMHGMSFALVTKETGRGREARGLTRIDLASIWLQVRVHEFTGKVGVVSISERGWRRGEGPYS